MRDGLGNYEDRFFATVFGSGLLFLAMVFSASAIGAGRPPAVRDRRAGRAERRRGVSVRWVLSLTKTYAVRMAAVFMISLATIWLKTELMPRWLVYVTYASAVGLHLAAACRCGSRWSSRSGCCSSVCWRWSRPA